jgi:thiamine biosynthesis protein ThiS
MNNSLPSQVMVNQETPVDIECGVSTILDALNTLALDSNSIAVAVNNTVIAKQTWAVHVLSHGDNLNVFGAIAGG